MTAKCFPGFFAYYAYGFGTFTDPIKARALRPQLPTSIPAQFRQFKSVLPQKYVIFRMRGIELTT